MCATDLGSGDECYLLHGAVRTAFSLRNGSSQGANRRVVDPFQGGQTLPFTRSSDATDGNDPHPCPHCAGRMIIIETVERGSMPRHRPKGPTIAIRIDTL
jgi:hypothetical protein